MALVLARVPASRSPRRSPGPGTGQRQAGSTPRDRPAPAPGTPRRPAPTRRIRAASCGRLRADGKEVGRPGRRPSRARRAQSRHEDHRRPRGSRPWQPEPEGARAQSERLAGTRDWRQRHRPGCGARARARARPRRWAWFPPAPAGSAVPPRGGPLRAPAGLVRARLGRRRRLARSRAVERGLQGS